ncbi:MAG: Ig-like domain-containing protein, partial [Rubrobacteraceae bacterium]
MRDVVLSNLRWVVVRAALLALVLLAISFTLTAPARANGTAQNVPFSQNWTDTGQISKNDKWDNVPGINGYLGGDITFTPGSDPQGTVADGAPTGLNVSANQTNPNTNTSGGVAEFQITNPTVALQPTDTADLPHLVLNLNTTGERNVNVSYLLRDIDGSADNAQQQMILQYRVGSSGNYTNLPAGYVADATEQSTATKTTQVRVTLPAAAENQAVVQVRVGSANAVGTDEWVGVDDIAVSSVPTVTLTTPPATANEGETKTYNYTVADTDAGDTFTVKNGFPDCGTGGTLSGTPTKTSTGGSFQCRFPDGSASPNVRVQVTDSRGLDSNTASQSVAVANVAPTVTLSGPATANEGETKSYDFTVTDPGQDTPSVRGGFPDCGTGGTFVSGSLQTGATAGSFQCRFPDGPSSPTVRMQVADEDGGNSNVATRGVTVANVAPAVTLDGPTTAAEGQTKSYSYGITDPGDDPNPTITENCGPNATKIDTPEANGFQCRFPDGPSSSAVSVSANDGDASNNSTSASRTVTVSNVAPTLDLSGPANADEGQTKAFDYTVADPGQDTFTVKSGFPDCGTGGTLSGTPTKTSTGGSLQCRFPDGPATSSVAVSATDEDGAAADDALQVDVSNAAPEAAGDPAQGDYSTDEDTRLSVAAGDGLLANDSDRGEDGLTARRVSAPDHGTAEVTEDGSFAYEPNGNYNGADSFTYEACDEDDACSPATTVKVEVAAVNDPPVLDLNGGANGTGHSATFTEGDDPVSVADGNALSVADVDSERIQSATVTLRDRPDGEAETLTAGASGTGISVNYDRPAGELRLNGPAPTNDYQKVLRTVAYENSSQDPATADRTVAFVANDGDADSEAATSTVTVRAVNDAPEISDIPDNATDEDTPTDPIPFTVRDVDTPAVDLKLFGSSDDTELVPNSGIEFGGTGGDRTVRVTPAKDLFGKVGISVKVDDGDLGASDDFVLTVRDTTPPGSPTVDLDAGSDTGASDTDDVTRDANPALSGEAEAGSEVAIFDGNDRISAVDANGGTWKFKVAEDAALEDGKHEI